MSFGQGIVVQQDMLQNKPWSNLMLSVGRGAYQSPVSPFGQTSNSANSTNPTNATLSNTAAGYTTLGGEFAFAAAAGAATDYALFAFQVPTGYQLIVPCVRISCVNTGAIGSAITPTILRWAIGVNASNVSLATTDSAGTSWAPRRIALGMQSWGLSAFIGQQPPDIVTQPADMVIDSGRFLHVIVRIPVGAATASQVFLGTVAFPGAYLE
jgi:hypothetical protein